jgi:hypothetical protein
MAQLKLESDPRRAASQILRECGGRRSEAENKAREAFEHHDGELGGEHVVTRFWSQVLWVIGDRSEDPPVPSPPPAMRFDANGRPTTAPPPEYTAGPHLSTE